MDDNVFDQPLGIEDENSLSLIKGGSAVRDLEQDKPRKYSAF